MSESWKPNRLQRGLAAGLVVLSLTSCKSSDGESGPSSINVQALLAESEQVPNAVTSDMSAVVRTYGYQCLAYVDGTCHYPRYTMASGFEVDVGDNKDTMTAGHVESPQYNDLPCADMSLIGRVGSLIFRDGVTNHNGSFKSDGVGADYRVPDVGIFQAANNELINQLPTIPVDAATPPVGSIVYGFGYAPTNTEKSIYKRGPDQKLPLRQPDRITGIVIGQYTHGVTDVLEIGTPSKEGDSGGPVVVGSGDKAGKAFGLISAVIPSQPFQAIEYSTGTTLVNSGNTQNYSQLLVQDINPNTVAGLADGMSLQPAC
jgi:hypothetical protein